jgi:membrane protease YdiL (CAAX protease family)
MNKFNVTAASLVLAAMLWTLIFLVRPLNFWLMMSFSTLLLMVIAVLINREKIEFRPRSRMLFLGVISGILLYTFFFVGFQLTRSNPIFNEGVAHVYDLRSATPNIFIAMLLVFPIAPGEEVYWRSLIQRRFMGKIGENAGFLFTASAYALVHLPTINLPLILTAFISGLVWGYLYKATGQLQPVIVSHVVFDLLIFVIAPFS